MSGGSEGQRCVLKRCLGIWLWLYSSFSCCGVCPQSGRWSTAALPVLRRLAMFVCLVGHEAIVGVAQRGWPDVGRRQQGGLERPYYNTLLVGWLGNAGVVVPCGSR